MGHRALFFTQLPILLHLWKQWPMEPAFPRFGAMRAEGPMTLAASYHAVFEWHFSGLKLEISLF